MGRRASSSLRALVCAGIVCGAATVTGVSAQSVELEPVGSIAGPADLVRASGGVLYVAAGPTLTIYSLSNVSAPQREGSYAFPEQIWGFRVEGDRAYVGANFFGLGILDVSDPAAPHLLGSYKTPSQTKIGATFRTKLAIIDHMEGLVLVDITNETTPVASDSFFLDGYARDVVTRGSMAYAIDSPSGLYVFDLSRPGPLEPIGVLHAPNAPHWIEISGDAAQGHTILCGAGGGDLQIYDVSDPAAPVKASTFATPGRAHRVSLVGNLAYVADGEEGIQVVDLSVPTEPRLAGTYRTARPARQVSTDGDLVFVVVGERGPGRDRAVQVLRTRPSA